MPPLDATAARTVLEALRQRRTCKAYTGQAVERAQLEELVGVAQWAPNHRLTLPWRFYVMGKPSIARLDAFLRVDPAFAEMRSEAAGAAKLQKLQDRLATAGALILTTWVQDDDPRLDREDHAATSAAIQNILLGAHAMGLGGYWSTAWALVCPATMRWCGADPDREAAAGCVWLGHATTLPHAPPRGDVAERVRWLDHA